MYFLLVFARYASDKRYASGYLYGKVKKIIM